MGLEGDGMEFPAGMPCLSGLVVPGFICENEVCDCIVLKLHAEHRMMSLREWIDRLGDVDVITSCKVVRLRTGTAPHAFVCVICIEPNQTYTVNLLYGIETAISICAVDRFAHTASCLSPCWEFLGSKRTEIVATRVVDHIVETKIAVVAIFRRSKHLEVIGKHHPSSTCCIQNLFFSHTNAKLWRTRQTLWGECTDANPKLSLNDT